MFHRVRHGQEDAVEQDGGHDDVIEERMSREVDGSPPERIPWREQEAGAGRRKPMDVILPEAVRYHNERLNGRKFKKKKIE